MGEAHRLAGRMGGLQTSFRYGHGWMCEIGRKGGRPTREEAARKAWNHYNASLKHAGRRGH